MEDLLIKLGELPMPGGNQSRRRVFATGDLQDAMQLMDRLKKVWPSRGRNELKFITPVIEPKEEPVILDVPDSPDQLEIGKPAPRAADQKPADEKPADQKPVSKPAGKTAQRSQRRNSSNPFRTTHIQFVTASQTQVVESDDAADSAKPVAEAPEVSAKPNAPVGTAPATADKSAAKDTAPAADATKSAEPATDAAIEFDKQKSDDALQRLIQRMRERGAAGRSESDAGSTEAPPIEIRISPNGELFIQSDDPAALDVLQEVLDEYAPPKRDWKVIKLKYPQTWAYGVEVILKDIFKEEIEASEGDNNSGMRYSPFYGYSRGSSGGSSSKPRRLSARKPLKIISDRDSHTILVQGASDEQLRMIEELIDIYDKPQSTEARSIRKTQIFKIRYSKANVIAEALKDVYRDLLSENDKALQEARGNKKEDRPSERSYTYIYGAGGEDGEEQEQPIRFKGLLSIGIDEAANILIISASEGLLNNVAQIVEELDLAAQPNSSYKVVQVNSRVNLRELQLKLKTMLGPKPPAQPNKNAKGQPQNNNSNNNNNNNFNNGK